MNTTPTINDIKAWHAMPEDDDGFKTEVWIDIISSAKLELIVRTWAPIGGYAFHFRVELDDDQNTVIECEIDKGEPVEPLFVYADNITGDNQITGDDAKPILRFMLIALHESADEALGEMSEQFGPVVAENNKRLVN